MVILRFWKIALHNEIINKTWSTKNQENSAHRSGNNYLTNNVVKFLQDRIKPWRVEALWWPIRAKMLLSMILISKVTLTFMFNLNLKVNLKLNFKFTSNSISFEIQFKFYFISDFHFKLTSKAFLFYFLF